MCVAAVSNMTEHVLSMNVHILLEISDRNPVIIHFTNSR